MFAAQIVDDLPDAENPVQDSDTLESGQPLESAVPGYDEADSEAEPMAPPEEDDGPDGAQYDEDFQAGDSYLDEYDGCEMPSDEDEPEYLRLMREDDSDDESSPPPLEDMPMDESEAEGSHSEAEDSDTAEHDEDPDEENSEFDGSVVPLDEDGQDYGSDGAQYDEDFECENLNYDEFDGSAAPSDEDDQDYGSDGGRHGQDSEEGNSTRGEFDGYATQPDEDEPEYLWVIQKSEADARPTSPQLEGGSVVDITCHHQKPWSSCLPYGTIKATVLPQSANPDRPADCLHHAGMRVITHNAHQCNMCDPWITHTDQAAASLGRLPDSAEIDALCRDRNGWRRQYSLKCDQLWDMQEVNARLRVDLAPPRDATLIEAEQQRDATILGRPSAECADSCQALRAAYAAMDDLRRNYNALCYQPGHPDVDNERLCDH
ncbi:hypothetical protein BC826DRAFT_1104736 [Russula brevipes]|nr:hypothetical protein BC826DRAFT_1104736 [Russula brevipes]